MQLWLYYKIKHQHGGIYESFTLQCCNRMWCQASNFVQLYNITLDNFWMLTNLFYIDKNQYFLKGYQNHCEIWRFHLNSMHHFFIKIISWPFTLIGWCNDCSAGHILLKYIITRIDIWIRIMIASYHERSNIWFDEHFY